MDKKYFVILLMFSINVYVTHLICKLTTYPPYANRKWSLVAVTFLRFTDLLNDLVAPLKTEFKG